MPLSVNFIEEDGKFNYFNLGAYLGPGETPEERLEQNRRALTFFQEYGLMPSKESPAVCISCGKKYGVEMDKSRGCLGFRWICKEMECSEYRKKVIQRDSKITMKS